MKTLKSVVTQDEKAAKVVGFIINAVLTITGAGTVIYGIVTWAQKNTQFSWGIFSFVTAMAGTIGIFQSVKF